MQHIIFKTISAASAMIEENDIPEIKSYVENSINSVPGFNVEYFEIVDDTELIPVRKKSEMKSRQQIFWMHCCESR